MEPEFSIFATPFNVNYEEVDAKFQLELIELNCNTLLKQTFHTVPLLEFYKNLSPDNFPNLITHAMKIMTMFGSSYICEQIFSTMKLRKTSLRNRITDEHLSSVLRISASQMEPDYDEILKKQSQFHFSHAPSTKKPVCLLCNTTVAVLKEYNIQRHFKSKHENHSYSSLSEEVKKIKSKDLIKNLSSQQQLFQRANHSQRCATKASYVLAYNIAKSNKAFSDGEFIKQCMIDVCDIMCPEKKNDFQSLSLSRRTITERIENIDKNLISQLTTKTQKFIFYSITMDESTDISDTAQLLIFVRGIDAHFEITEELAGLQSMKGTTTGADIFCEFENCIDKLRLPIDKLCNDALCKSAIDIDHILNIVVKLVNMIRSRGLLHRQFQQFLESVHAEHSDILYYSKVLKEYLGFKRRYCEFSS
nr:general transcription factor II-I repeat domain-containing protein 2A-like [Parasteatoda tepidariorum]